MKRKLLLLTALLCLVAMCVLLISCGGKKCEHTYYADCDTTCNECGETREVSAEHYYYGDCDSACHKCGEEREDVIEHKWVQIPNDTSCSVREACEGCGAIKGEITPHSWQEATCVAPKTCTACGATEGEALEHSPEEDDYDCTTALKCQNCDYIFVSAKSHAVDEENIYSTDEVHYNECTNDGCEVQINKEAHSGEDDGDCTTWVLCKCGWLIKEANESHTAEEDDGDCTTAVKCINCEQIVIEAYESHILNGCICENCGITKHEFSPTKLCQCAYCGEYIHTLDENCICTVCGATEHKEVDTNTGICPSCNGFVAVASIIANGTKSYYSTLEDAAYAVIQNGEGTIVLEKDITADMLEISNYSITLDLNGKTLNGNYSYSFLVLEGGSLTIKDSVGTGAVINNISADAGSLSIEGGRFEGTIYSGEGTVNITGGEFNYLIVNGSSQAMLAISGGSFSFINIHESINTPAGILADGYCYYDSEGNKMDASDFIPEEGWYKLTNVTVGKDE